MAQLSLAWIMSQNGMFLSTVILPVETIKIQGVTAPIVGTTSLENLYDLLGMVYFNSFF
jgi:aryl-alcohol dehydrogenase-like predicted oxidoreductase